jgi:hypothetical protein
MSSKRGILDEDIRAIAAREPLDAQDVIAAARRFCDRIFGPLDSVTGRSTTSIRRSFFSRDLACGFLRCEVPAV